MMRPEAALCITPFPYGVAEMNTPSRLTRHVVPVCRGHLRRVTSRVMPGRQLTRMSSAPWSGLDVTHETGAGLEIGHVQGAEARGGGLFAELGEGPASTRSVRCPRSAAMTRQRRCQMAADFRTQAAEAA